MRMPVLVVGALLAARSVAAEHDFWLVPNAFAVQRGETLDVAGRTSSRFPESESAVAPEWVKAARRISARGESPITDLSVAGKSLHLRHRPDANGATMWLAWPACSSRPVTRWLVGVAS